MGFKIKGLDKLQKQLKKMESGVKELEQTKEVSFDILFNPHFMRRNTQFSTIDEFIEAGGFSATTNEEFEAIPDDELDQHTRENTKFKSWEDMLGAATQEYASKKLGF